MSMTPKLWSLNALAVELHMDRRTVAKRLAHVPADGYRRGKPAWRLATALKVMPPATSGHPKGLDPQEPPPGLQVVKLVPDRDKPLVAVLLAHVYDVTNWLYTIAREDFGFSPDLSLRLTKALMGCMYLRAHGQLAGLSIEPFASHDDRFYIDFDAFGFDLRSTPDEVEALHCQNIEGFPRDRSESDAQEVP